MLIIADNVDTAVTKLLEYFSAPDIIIALQKRGYDLPALLARAEQFNTNKDELPDDTYDMLEERIERRERDWIAQGRPQSDEYDYYGDNE